MSIAGALAVLAGLTLAGRRRGGRRGPSRDTRDDRTRAQALTLLRDARTEIAQADQKASILLAAVGVIVIVFLGALLNGYWSPMALAAPWLWLWWTGAIAFGAAVSMFAVAVFPRIGPRGTGRGPGVSSFLDVVACSDERELYRSIEGSHTAGTDDILRELLELSRIVYRKYVLLRVGIALLAPAAVCSAAASIGSSLA